jgi:hypothetical protein
MGGGLKASGVRQLVGTQKNLMGFYRVLIIFAAP